MDYSGFYTELGRLAYAIARADGIIQSEEVDKVCDFIGQEIEKTDSQDHNMLEAVLGAAAEFNRLRASNASAKDAFVDFLTYIDNNTGIFNLRNKNLSVNIAFRIAAAYEGIDETEKALIDKLKKKLDSINHTGTT